MPSGVAVTSLPAKIQCGITMFAWRLTLDWRHCEANGTNTMWWWALESQRKDERGLGSRPVGSHCHQPPGHRDLPP